jgi:hypothetical protein
MSYWLRTGMMVPADVLELKFGPYPLGGNPNHGLDGRFTTGPGAGLAAAPLRHMLAGRSRYSRRADRYTEIQQRLDSLGKNSF